MARTRYTAEEIICHLRTIEIEAGKGIGPADIPPSATSARWSSNSGPLTQPAVYRESGEVQGSRETGTLAGVRWR